MAKLNMTNTKMRGPLTPCQEQIEGTMTDLRNALERAEGSTASPSSERQSAEADVCLETRSAYLDFYTWLVLHGAVDAAAEGELDALFLRALAVLTEVRFQTAVQLRYEDFKSECEHVRKNTVRTERAGSV